MFETKKEPLLIIRKLFVEFLFFDASKQITHLFWRSGTALFQQDTKIIIRHI